MQAGQAPADDDDDDDDDDDEDVVEVAPPPPAAAGGKRARGKQTAPEVVVIDDDGDDGPVEVAGSLEMEAGRDVDVGALKVAELKERLTHLGLDTAGKKAVLVERLTLALAQAKTNAKAEPTAKKPKRSAASSAAASSAMASTSSKKRAAPTKARKVGTLHRQAAHHTSIHAAADPMMLPRGFLMMDLA